MDKNKQYPIVNKVKGIKCLAIYHLCLSTSWEHIIGLRGLDKKRFSKYLHNLVCFFISHK